MCTVPTLTVKTPINEDTHWLSMSLRGMKETVMMNKLNNRSYRTLSTPANGILGSIFSDSQNIKLNSDHFKVFCGAKVCVATILKNSKLCFLNIILEDLIRVIMRVALEIFGFVKLYM